MNSYNFSVLNDKEFEELCADILSVRLSTHVEHFKPGPDGGVDCRYFSVSGEIIIQCKHWMNSTFSKLKSYLKQVEYKKIEKISPQKYILMTSLDLSRKEKQELTRALHPFISEEDIWGLRDITDLLNRPEYSHIQRNHYKLWITSSTVLNNFFHNDIYGRSQSEYNIFVESIPYYVETTDRKKAFEKLESKHSIIITGAPGIGKTTLAGQLCLYYAAQGFEIIIISKEINEAEKVYLPGQKQIFFFDDFLGSNYLCALDNKEDSAVVKFIKRISTDPSKRFILTSRTNILNQGKRLSQYFHDAKIEQNEFELKIANLDILSKAKILYSHIWHSKLPEEFIDAFYENLRYMNIIKHRNFNPRIIAYITDSDRLNASNSKDYWTEINSMLDNPQDIWMGVFDSQLDDIQRYLVLLVFWNKGVCDEKLFKPAFEACISELQSHLPPGLSTKFAYNIKPVVGSVLNRNIDTQKIIYYTLFDPSIGDYILNNCVTDLAYVLTPLKALRTESSLALFLSLYKTTVIPENIWNTTFKWYASQIVPNGLNQSICIKLINFIIDEKISSEYETILKYLKHITPDALEVSPLGDLLSALNWFYLHDDEYDWEQLYSNENIVKDLCEAAKDIDELAELQSFLKMISKDQYFDLPQEFYLNVEMYYATNINQIASDKLNASDFVLYDDDSMIVQQCVEEKLIEKISDELSEKNIDCNMVDLGNCIDGFDFADFLHDFLDDYNVKDTPVKDSASSKSLEEQIHELFKR